MSASPEEIQRAYQNFDETFGISIPEASRANLARLTAEIGALSPDEQKIYDTLIALPFTLRHGTAFGDLIRQSGQLLSVQERARLGAEQRNTHTGAHGNRDDNLFFVLGAGEHRVPSFLGNETEIITIPVTQEVLKETGIFIAPHLSEFVGERTVIPRIFGDTRRITKHVWNLDHETLDETREKTTQYKRADGTVVERKYGLGDEIFLGEDIIPGLALKFIQELRDVGPAYQKLIFDRLSDRDFVADIYNAHFQSWIYPEAQVPVRLDLARYGAEWSKSEMHPKAEALHLAARDGNIREIDRLLAEGVPVDVPFKDKASPLLAAILKGQSDAALHLLDKGADPAKYETCMFGDTQILPMSIRWCDDRVTMRIIENGIVADPSFGFVKHTIGKSLAEALECSITYKKPGVTRAILAKFGDDIDFSTTMLVSSSCASKAYDWAEYFAKRGAPVDRPYRAMMAATNTPLMQLALDVSTTDKVMTKLAAKGIGAGEPAKPSEAVALAGKLIDMGAKVNEVYRKPIGMFGAKPGENFRTALWLAAENGNMAMVKLLVERGADVNLANDLQETPRHAAERSGYAAIADYIGQHGGLSVPPQEVSVAKARHAEYTCAALVTGTDAKGERYVLMGRNRTKDGSGLLDDYRFPGGGVDNDTSPLTAVLKEVYEETGLNLYKLLPPEKLRDALMQHYEHVEVVRNERRSDGVETALRDHKTYIFDIGDALQDVKVRAGDDFLAAKWVSLAKDFAIDSARPVMKRYSVDGVPVLGSNGMLAELVSNGEFKPMPDALARVDGQLDLEYHAGQRILDAFRARDMARIGELLDAGVSLDGRGRFVTEKCNYAPTPLGLSAFLGDLELLDFALTHQATVNTQNLGSDGPLELAVMGKSPNRLEVIRRLLDAGAEPDGFLDSVQAKKYNNRYNPLRRAIKEKDHDVVDLLLARGADVNFIDESSLPDSDLSAVTDAINEGDARTLRSVLSCHPALHLTWFSDLEDKTCSLDVFRHAQEKGNKEITAMVAAEELRQNLAEKLNLPPDSFSLSLHPDDSGKPSLHVGFRDKAQAEALNALVNATPRLDAATREHYLRLGEVRIARLFVDESFGRDIYKALALSANVPGINSQISKPFAASAAKEQAVEATATPTQEVVAPQPKANALN